MICFKYLLNKKAEQFMSGEQKQKLKQQLLNIATGVRGKMS
jgi:hypothetical protein